MIDERLRAPDRRTGARKTMHRRDFRLAILVPLAGAGVRLSRFLTQPLSPPPTSACAFAAP
jgi:hypothetical protein